jgi:hypothetical protein
LGREDTVVSLTLQAVPSGATVVCNFSEVQSFATKRILEDFWASGVHNWTTNPGINLHLSNYTEPLGLILGGEGVLSLTNWLTKVFYLPEHLGVDMSFSIVLVDVPNMGCLWRVYVDGKLIVQKSIADIRSGTIKSYPGVGNQPNDGIIDVVFSIAVKSFLAFLIFLAHLPCPESPCSNIELNH